tara:strand:- start:57 stop:284 length:228 start_codon:yes stop_codon:yes gene_type:complete
MSKKVTLNIDRDLYQRLERRFKADERGLKQFIINAIRNQLDTSETLNQGKNNDLGEYLQKGSSGSRTYGVKGQGW